MGDTKGGRSAERTACCGDCVPRREFDAVVDDVEELRTELKDLREELCNDHEHYIRRTEMDPEKFVTQKEWEPVKMIAYGLVGMILFAVFSALVGLVVVTRSSSH